MHEMESGIGTKTEIDYFAHWLIIPKTVLRSKNNDTVSKMEKLVECSTFVDCVLVPFFSSIIGYVKYFVSGQS